MTNEDVLEVILGETRVTKRIAGYGEYDGTVIANGEKELTFVVKFDDDDGLEQTMTLKQVNAAVKKFIKKHAKPETWACAFCTFENPLAKKKCGMCQAANPIKPSSMLKKKSRAEKENSVGVEN